MTARVRPGNVRIIGGSLRGRRLPVPALQEVRPSPDRVRETLFNWLQYVLPGRNCLDLFGGTGVLGFEAASRGAKQVTIVDRHPEVVASLRANAAQLGTGDSLRIVQAEALAWLSTCAAPLDVVFLDPPFHCDLVRAASTMLAQRRLLRPEARIYIEMEATTDPQLPSHWERLKAKTAGQVSYYLYASAPVAESALSNE